LGLSGNVNPAHEPLSVRFKVEGRIMQGAGHNIWRNDAHGHSSSHHLITLTKHDRAQDARN